MVFYSVWRGQITADNSPSQARLVSTVTRCMGGAGLVWLPTLFMTFDLCLFSNNEATAPPTLAVTGGGRAQAITAHLATAWTRGPQTF